jgi:hypothetical protein
LWSKADVVGGDSSIPKKKKSTPRNSETAPQKRNGKRVISEAFENSDPSDEESTGDASDESRFSDSEDDD